MSRLGYLALGVDEVQRLSVEKNLVVDLTIAEIIGLGRTVYDRHRAKYPHDGQVLDPVGHAILAQIVAERDPTRPGYRSPEPEPNPIRDQERALIERSNQCLVECHAQGRLDTCPYVELHLDQKYGHEPILHLDPAPDQGQRPSFTLGKPDKSDIGIEDGRDRGQGHSYTRARPRNGRPFREE
jgi:hypothetical protein